MTLWKVTLCAFNCKPRPSGVSLKSPGLENIPQVPGNRAELGQNHDARKAGSATISVLKWSTVVFRPRRSKLSVQKVFLRPFHCKPRPSGVSLESPGLENMAKILENRAEVAQNHDARKAVSATLSVLKWRLAIFHTRNSKIRLQKVLLCSFHCKSRPSGVSLDPSGLENIAQVRGNRPEFFQNHVSRKAVSATLWFLKWTGAIFRPRS